MGSQFGGCGERSEAAGHDSNLDSTILALYNPRMASALAQALLPWFRANGRALPWRGSTDSYAIWVSEIMLQQTRVDTVLPYYARWMERFPTVRSVAAAPLDEVLRAWEGLGYQRGGASPH